jgi:hypothetical protein
LISHVPLLCRVSWLLSGTSTTQSWLGDNRPDVHDEADFDIPNTQAVLERFMSNMSKLADVEYQVLSDLLDSLPDPSRYTTAKTMTAAAPRENGVVRRSRVFMDFFIYGL